MSDFQARLDELRRETRRDALAARDRFYRAAAGGQIPADLASELRTVTAQFHADVRAAGPPGEWHDLPGTDFCHGRLEDFSVRAREIDFGRCVEIIDELDAFARERGFPEVEA